MRLAIVCDNFSPHLTTKRCRRVANWAEANNVEIAYTPTNSSWLNRIEAQFTALRYFALDGTDHSSHREQASMIRRYIIWRNKHAADDGYGRSSTRQTLPDAALETARRPCPEGWGRLREPW
ncbi:transposase [Rhodococcus wratislaviensis IFP 2016]|uniref:transposase n=1 Tax=Rhodococcus opacus TaxID=37919 RepID=UPI0002A4210F|nr:transposase [Rhodococcus opacus]ELB92685.1 transposase [Rhodococcus wratislaviensis IFP 2016]